MSSQKTYITNDKEYIQALQQIRDQGPPGRRVRGYQGNPFTYKPHLPLGNEDFYQRRYQKKRFDVFRVQAELHVPQSSSQSTQNAYDYQQYAPQQPPPLPPTQHQQNYQNLYEYDYSNDPVVQSAYPRNLINTDIEGSQPGTLISKCVRNKQKAQRMLEQTGQNFNQVAHPNISQNHDQHQQNANHYTPTRQRQRTESVSAVAHYTEPPKQIIRTYENNTPYDAPAHSGDRTGTNSRQIQRRPTPQAQAPALAPASDQRAEGVYDAAKTNQKNFYKPQNDALQQHINSAQRDLHFSQQQQQQQIPQPYQAYQPSVHYPSQAQQHRMENARAHSKSLQAQSFTLPQGVVQATTPNTLLPSTSALVARHHNSVHDVLQMQAPVTQGLDNGRSGSIAPLSLSVVNPTLNNSPRTILPGLSPAPYAPPVQLDLREQYQKIQGKMADNIIKKHHLNSYNPILHAQRVAHVEGSSPFSKPTFNPTYISFAQRGDLDRFGYIPDANQGPSLFNQNYGINHNSFDAQTLGLNNYYKYPTHNLPDSFNHLQANQLPPGSGLPGSRRTPNVQAVNQTYL